MKTFLSIILISSLAMAIIGCSNNRVKSNGSPEGYILDKEKFSAVIDGEPVSLFYLTNKNGMYAAITNYGGRVVSLLVPTSNNEFTDVVVGFATAEEFASSTEPYFGALIGRYGNRIANGRFSIEGKEYILPQNNGPNTLHGGLKGFHYAVWDAVQENDSVLVLSYFSPDGTEGFPGNLQVKVIYSLTEDNALKIDYEAKTDQLTPINLTNHAFFNLNGEGSGTIENHLLCINADYYLPVDETLIPTGESAIVEDTPFDFRKMTVVGLRLDTTEVEQLRFGKGYDHNFILRQNRSNELFHAATIKGDLSGIQMDIFTLEPGLQFYSGNFMAGQNTFKNGTRDYFRTAFCLETQHFPDSPNQPHFPTALLEPGQLYRTTTIYKFSY